MGLKENFKERTESKMLFCKKCGRHRAFYKEDDEWVCVGCGFEIKENEKSN